MKYMCPCCNCFTMEHDEAVYHDICPVCFWENDPIQNDDEKYIGGSNDISLSEARANYQKFGAAKQEFIKCVRSPYLDEMSK